MQQKVRLKHTQKTGARARPANSSTRPSPSPVAACHSPSLCCFSFSLPVLSRSLSMLLLSDPTSCCRVASRQKRDEPDVRQSDRNSDRDKGGRELLPAAGIDGPRCPFLPCEEGDVQRMLQIARIILCRCSSFYCCRRGIWLHAGEKQGRQQSPSWGEFQQRSNTNPIESPSGLPSGVFAQILLDTLSRRVLALSLQPTLPVSLFPISLFFFPSSQHGRRNVCSSPPACHRELVR